MAAVVEIDANLTMTAVNDEFATRVMVRKAAVGMNFLDLFEEADTQGVRDALARAAAAGGNMVKIDGLRIFTFGSGPNDFPHTVSYDWTLLKHNDGFIGIASRQEGDTTSTTLSAEAEELKDFFNKAPIALHWLDSNGKVLWANDRELEVLGYSREEYIGSDIMNFCPDSADDVLEIFKQLGSGNTIRDVPVRFRTKTGKIQDLLIDSNVNYKTDGSFNHTRCFIRDDTGRILREARAEAAATAATKLAAGKERFSSKLLHAVKTPIHAIALCMSDPNSIDAPLVAAQVRELAGLIASVSKAIKFDDGYVVKPLPAPLNLSSLVQGYRKLEGVRHEVVVDQIGFDASVFVLADASMIRTVLDELVRHADERSPAGASVRLSVEHNKMISGGEGEGGGQGEGMGDGGAAHSFEFRVVDSGPELTESRVEKVFHNYWLGDADAIIDGDNREERQESDASWTDEEGEEKKQTLRTQLSSSEETPSLRLNVAFNYVQCLDSTLRVDSDTSRTVFKFTLNLEPSLHQAEEEEEEEEGQELQRGVAITTASSLRHYPRWKQLLPSATSSPHNILFPKAHPGACIYGSGCKHVLIVEDNTICQKLCHRLVTNLGHTADTADNGAIAVEMVTTRDVNIYDIVLMDLRMPVMDGLTAAKKIHEKFSDLPIVALSAEEGESTREAVRDHMVMFVNKPSSAGRVREAIEKHARHSLGQIGGLQGHLRSPGAQQLPPMKGKLNEGPSGTVRPPGRAQLPAMKKPLLAGNAIIGILTERGA